MVTDIVNQLIKVIVRERFVNCYSREFSPENQQELKHFLLKLKESYKNIYVDIDIRKFEKSKGEEQDAKALLQLINRELTGKGIKGFQTRAFSIATALSRWSANLDRQALLVFHCFHDLYSEKEKNILRSLRKTLRNSDEMSGYLGLLIVSNREVFKWELFPESNLDERHVAFFEY